MRKRFVLLLNFQNASIVRQVLLGQMYSCSGITVGLEIGNLANTESKKCTSQRSYKYSYKGWLKSLPSDCKIVVIEVGAGLAVPTIRMTSEETVRKYANGHLIRINLRDNNVPGKEYPDHLLIGNVISDT
jgi:hypothetical protein